jgi:two-component system, OmpR family, response regulator
VTNCRAQEPVCVEQGVTFVGEQSFTLWLLVVGVNETKLRERVVQVVERYNSREMSQPTHIVVVDDDHEIRTLLAEYLEKSGLRVSVARDGKEMRRVLGRGRVDLIVLDIMLPGEDGLTLCRELRASSLVPIIMLTARSEDVDRILGLELGADDYVPKPFKPRELLARITAVLRRTVHVVREPLPSDVPGYRFAGWRLDTTARSLTHDDGTGVALSGAEFRLLAVLLAHAGKVLSRQQLMDLLRGRDLDPFDRSIDQRVSRLRQILKDDARSPRIIKTVYGEGYVIGVPVEPE